MTMSEHVAERCPRCGSNAFVLLALRRAKARLNKGGGGA